MSTMAYGREHDRPRAPHWMRSMEEKYQRLHARIEDQAVRHSQSRNSLSVRIRELRQGRYTTQRKDPGRSSDNSKGGNVSSPQKEYNTSNLSTDPAEMNSRIAELPEDQSLSIDCPNLDNPAENVKRKFDPPDDVSQRRTFSEIPSNDIDEQDDNIPETDTGTSQQNEFSQELDEYVKSSNFVKSEGRNLVGSSKTDKRQIDVESNNGVEEKKIRERYGPIRNKNVKQKRPVSEPWPSKETSKSSGQFKDNQTRNTKDNKKNSKPSSSSFHSRLKHSRSAATSLNPGRQPEVLVFSSMSQEAQHAKVETLKEMVLVEKIQDETENEEGFSARPIKTGIHSNSDEDIKLERPETGYSLESGDNGIIEDSTSNPQIANNNPLYSDSNITTDSKDHDHKHNDHKPTRSLKNRLKATKCVGQEITLDDGQNASTMTQRIQNKTAPEDYGISTRDCFQAHRSPLPAIRPLNRWRTHGQDSFNITSPDFDIRFCETSSYQRGDCDAPSEDIRRQSIEKCRLWLENQLGKL